MSTELRALPDSFAAGTTIIYRKQFADYPASEGWTLTLYFAGACVEQVTAEADGDDFVVTVDADVTGQGWEPGLYKWAERVAGDGAVYQLASGVVNILPDLTVAIDEKSQEWIEQVIPLLRAHVKGRIPAGMESYQVAGRAISKIPLREAIVMLTQLEERLERMKNPGDATSGTIYVKFSPPGY